MWTQRSPIIHKRVISRNNLRKITVKKRKFFLIKALLSKLVLKYKDDFKAHKQWFLIIQSMLKTFVLTSQSLQQNLASFSKFFYKKLRQIQSLIKILRPKIVKLYNFKLLQYVNNVAFFNTWTNIGTMAKPYSSDLFNTKLKALFLSNISHFDTFIQLKDDFGIHIKFIEESKDDFNLYLFQFYLKLYELEECLQWFNWIIFRSDTTEGPYKFYKETILIDFLKVVRTCGYQFWHKRHFKRMHSVSTKRFKLKKKWRFWREFKKYLLFDKSHIFVKFDWLYNNKRLLNHQFLESYSTAVTLKLKQFYKNKISKPRLITFLSNIEYRLDVLTLRIFKVKSIKWIWILLYFGYITINLKKKSRSYVLQRGDLIFGWFLLKNFLFVFRLTKRLNKPCKLYNFLEFESFLNTFICLRFPIKYIRDTSGDDRLISKKFIKYMYLKSY